MQADSHSNVTVWREQKPVWWNNPPRPPRPCHPFHPSMFLFMSSWSRQYFSATSATPLLVSYQDSLVSWAPCFADCQWKGQPSFSQQRMSLLVPRPPLRVHKNLHDSSWKCQYIESMVIRRLRHYSCLPRYELEEFAENHLLANTRSKGWIMLFSPRMITLCTHRNTAITSLHKLSFFLLLWLQCVKERLTSSGESEQE